MRKTVVAVFAHPDDEAFGPSGTLAKLSKTNDVYLVCVTEGEAGKNSLKNTQKELSKIRKQELHTSAKILGIKKVFCLGFADGTLSNNVYHEVAQKIQKLLEKLEPEIIITYEQGGISGHLDHIATHLITTFAVKKLSFLPQIWYYFVPKEISTLPEDYFVHPPALYSINQADIVIDTEKMWDTKIKAMHAHKSQMHDANRIISKIKDLPKKEYFLKFKR